MVWKNGGKIFHSVENRMNASLPSVVVTGAAGFIGRRVVARLAAAGRPVLAVDRVPCPSGLPPGVEYRCADLAAEPLRVPDGILVHLAWNMNRADARAQTESAADFARLLETGAWSGVVGLGSAEEYGNSEGCLEEAQAPGNCLSAYGTAKHAAGRALQAWTERQSGRPAFWLRPFVVYGPGQGGSMAIPYAMQCARARKPAEFSAGLQFRDFVHVDDVAAGIAQAALRVSAGNGTFRTCNLGRGEPVRLRDVLERIAEKTRARDLFRFGVRPMRPDEPQQQYAHAGAAQQALGWQAQISWETGIDEMCKDDQP